MRFQKILILPDAGPENPFQYQMIEFLKSQGFEVSVGEKKNLGSIYKAVNQFNPDIIYFDWVHSYIIGRTFLWSLIKSLFFVLEISYLCFFRKIPIIHTLHNTQNHGGYWLKWEQIIYGFFLRKCAKIRVYSETIRQEIIRRFGVPSGTVYIIQDIPYHHYYPDNISKKESRTYFNIIENGFTFLFFGKIKQYKGLEDLIRAFENIKKSGDYLLIAGECLDNNYLKYIKKITGNCPEIMWYDQFINKDEVQYFFNAANVVVLPFTRIDHSGSIDLAMSFSKPVITLKTGAATELLAHQDCLLFETSSTLESCMDLARKINLEEIGIKNFKKADSSNYHELLTLFQKV
ncbi:glycosyltransferase family 4 protein [Dyadobacter sp. CY356]|uniref:glycosyltransferase family 4 protein n=1 Tax=Dyadobacter sp. CY356 TaxID=2906442 RepID=UPI001F17B762|nr:glycosyltransferase family 4 protein [Dyadobacter sp. CY356]MCF0056743.1 glycosyltransferase family 4 protein [Dyadobacter sp. CY356]